MSSEIQMAAKSGVATRLLAKVMMPMVIAGGSAGGAIYYQDQLPDFLLTGISRSDASDDFVISDRIRKELTITRDQSGFAHFTIDVEAKVAEDYFANRESWEEKRAGFHVEHARHFPIIVLQNMDSPEFALMGAGKRIESELQRESEEEKREFLRRQEARKKPKPEDSAVRQLRRPPEDFWEEREPLDDDGGDLIVTKRFRFLSPPSERKNGKVEFLVFENAAVTETDPTDYSRVRSVEYKIRIER